MPVYPRGFPCAGIWSPLCTAPWPCLQPRYIFKLFNLEHTVQGSQTYPNLLTMRHRLAESERLVFDWNTFFLHFAYIINADQNETNSLLLWSLDIYINIIKVVKWGMNWPSGNVLLQTHLIFMTIYGSLNIRWLFCTSMCHWLCDITLTSNETETKFNTWAPSENLVSWLRGNNGFYFNRSM